LLDAGCVGGIYRCELFTGDGDSSVMSRLTETQPYGPSTTISKIECTNHLLRNYCRKVRDVSDQRRNEKGPVPGELRGIISQNVLRLRRAVTGAVGHHLSSSEEMHVKTRRLAADIKNGPYHVFGDHEKCDPYFCDGRKDDEKNHVERLKAFGVWKDVIAASNYLSVFSYSLLHRVTTNCAENFNSKVCKFVNGKRTNLVLRNSYTVRSELSALSVNKREDTFRLIHKSANFGRSPGFHSKKIADRKRARNEKTRSRRSLFHPGKLVRKKQVHHADEDYGNVPCSYTDIPHEELEEKKKDFIQSLHLNESGRKQLEENSRGQSTSELWKAERRKRVTASNFGKICKMRATTSSQKTVVSLLYSEFKGTAATRYGIEHEGAAIAELQELIGMAVEECGLFVDQEYPFLAASPDGTIGEHGLVEIKCPANAKTYTPAEAARNNKITSCTVDENGDIHLKKNHNYYYQVQGQLHITRKRFCLFVLWTPKGISVEKIVKDDQFWKEKMETQLVTFFTECLLPELVDPRYPRGLPVRDRNRE